MSSKITTHVLDLAKGRPASGLEVSLWHSVSGGEVGSGCWRLLASVRLNADGRGDGPLAEGGLAPGVYELRFDVGSYYGSESAGFLGMVPVRFMVAGGESHYHIPLLVSPGGYSTYRGS